ncbi:hypothetical protein B0T22DRAFT_194679, partial [Podospora appendiculata]
QHTHTLTHSLNSHIQSPNNNHIRFYSRHQTSNINQQPTKSSPLNPTQTVNMKTSCAIIIATAISMASAVTISLPSGISIPSGISLPSGVTVVSASPSATAVTATVNARQLGAQSSQGTKSKRQNGAQTQSSNAQQTGKANNGLNGRRAAPAN